MIELVWDSECPYVDAAREVLRNVLGDAERPRRWGEWNVADDLTPGDRRGYGSPTILVDGRDIADAAPAGASSCRIYRHADGEMRGGPPAELLARALTDDSRDEWRGFPHIETPRLTIGVAGPADAEDLRSYFERNRDHLSGWDPVRPDDFYTREFWDQRLAAQREEFLDDRSACFAGRLAGQSEVVAIANLRNFVRGAFQACHLGYSVDARHEGRGVMSEMVGAVVDFAFDELHLHRVMANYLPENERSARLLERLGFEREGYARDYLQIGGSWRDHVLTARVRR